VATAFRRADTVVAARDAGRPIGRWLARWTILVHRWLGIAVCLLVAIWTFSGIVLMFILPPRLSEAERLAAARPIAFGAVRVAPGAALAAAGLDEYPRAFVLEQAPGGPVYRIEAKDGAHHAVLAVDGRVLPPAGEAAAIAAARLFRADASVRSAERIDHDQWTWASKHDPHRPLWRITLDDPAQTQLYVSSRTGAVVLDASSAERFWGWLGYMPHLLDLKPICGNEALYRPLMLWTVGPCILMSLAGLYVGIARLRLRRRYSRSRMTPYRGWAKWHHVTGVIGGIAMLGWIVSTFIYLRPGGYLDRSELGQAALDRYAAHSAPTFPAGASALPRSDATTRRVRFVWVSGRPFIVLDDAAGRSTLLDAQGRPTVLRPSDIVAAASRLLPDAEIASAVRLNAPDEYWHSFRSTHRKLPALRVAFDDPARTWVHIDPATGDVLGSADADDRTFRWLFNALHKFDVLALLRLGAVRDLLLAGLLLLSLAMAVSGVVMGWRRLSRHAAAKP
jgi:uncharacterized iron-regulated membrane protein